MTLHDYNVLIIYTSGFTEALVWPGVSVQDVTARVVLHVQFAPDIEAIGVKLKND